MYVFWLDQCMSQTNQTEASMNNQFYCHLLVWLCEYLWTLPKHSSARWQRNWYHFALFHTRLQSGDLKL